MINAKTAMRSASAIQCCTEPIGPVVIASMDRPTGTGQSLDALTLTYEPAWLGLTSK